MKFVLCIGHQWNLMGKLFDGEASNFDLFDAEIASFSIFSCSLRSNICQWIQSGTDFVSEFLLVKREFGHEN